MTTIRNLMSPEDIAAMAETSMAACLNAADQLKALGTAAMEMASVFDDRCKDRAQRLMDEGQSIAQGVMQFAQTIKEQAEQVDALAAHNGVDGRPKGADAYGLRRLAVEDQERAAAEGGDRRPRLPHFLQQGPEPGEGR